jgi:heme/copper-type cytochrome/quinol oxidase subunit 3
MRHRPVQDVSALPDHAFGPRMTMWWGTLGFMTLEGTGFALAAGAYLYLVWLNPQWPLADRPPDLSWATLLTLVLLVSLWPNQIAKKNAKREDLSRVRGDLLLMSFISIVVLAIRAFEFGTLNVRWDQNAYGSIVWVLLGLHTAHLLTDAIDTFVLTALMFTRHAHGKRFSDVEDNAFYWDFVVLSWLPIYGLIYWASRV